jgi:hypothetical protein
VYVCVGANAGEIKTKRGERRGPHYQPFLLPLPLRAEVAEIKEVPLLDEDGVNTITIFKLRRRHSSPAK